MVSVVAAEDAEIIEADKIIVHAQLLLLKPHLHPKNLIKRGQGILTDPQIVPAVVTGLKVVQRPTVQIHWSVVGLQSSLQDRRIILIERLACLALRIIQT